MYSNVTRLAHKYIQNTTYILTYSVNTHVHHTRRDTNLLTNAPIRLSHVSSLLAALQSRNYGGTMSFPANLC